MLCGDHEAAWAISDQVLAARDPSTRDQPGVPYHRRWVWDGRPFDERHVLVRCYHGLGDTLQFARFLPLLRRRAASLTVELQPELMDVLARLTGPDRWIAFRTAAPAARSECDLEIMELSHALRLRPETVPPPDLGFGAPPAGGIGLCWQAGGWDPARSAPFADLAAVFRGQEVFTLHPSPPPPGLSWLNQAGCPTAISGTADLIAGLDLVVTVDTMVAHLAGTLNRPTALLLKHDADWRWMRDRADSPWYPSMRLYRQAAPGDWASALASLARDLPHLIGAAER